MSKRQLSFASRSFFVQRKIPVTSKAPRRKREFSALKDFVVFGAADVLSASVFYQRKNFSKAFF